MKDNILLLIPVNSKDLSIQLCCCCCCCCHCFHCFCCRHFFLSS